MAAKGEGNNKALTKAKEKGVVRKVLERKRRPRPRAPDYECASRMAILSWTR